MSRCAIDWLVTNRSLNYHETYPYAGRRLLLWKDWDKLPPSDGALPAPPQADSNSESHSDNKSAPAVGSDHVAPLAGYYNRASKASEALVFTSASMKHWEHQPRPQPPLEWAKRHAAQLRWQQEQARKANQTYAETQVGVDGEALSEDNSTKGYYTGLVQSKRIGLDCQPGLANDG